MNAGTNGKGILVEDEDHVPRKGLENLPIEISHDIFSRVPMSSLVQSANVSRTWRKLSHEVSVLNLNLLQTGQNNPSLIFQCLDSARHQLHLVELSDPLCDNKIVGKVNVPFRTSLPDKIHILGSCNGLLCISNQFRNDPYYIYNPYTRKYKRIPKSMQFKGQIVEAGFGYDLIVNEYKLVKMVYYKDTYTGPIPRQVYTRGSPNYPQSDVQICDISSNRWRSLGRIPYQFRPQSTEDLGSSKYIICLSGRLHWIKRSGRHYGFNNNIPKIVSFDLSSEQFHEVLKPACGSLNNPNYILLVLRGCLSAAVYCQDGKVEMWMMKEYNVRESWIKEFNIETHPRYIDAGLQRSSNVRVFCVHGIWRSRVLHGKSVRVLCFLKNGNILLEYKDGKLASYDLENGETTDLQFQQLPTRFDTIVHFGSLNWIDES